MNTNPRQLAEAFLSARRGWSGGLVMAATEPTDVPDWNPGIVEAAFYDRMDDPALVLTGLAARYNDLNGGPGDSIRIPTDAVTTPAANLAVDVPATDDSLGSDSFTMTLKEAVKSIAWYDRTQEVSSENVNQRAGRKVGTAVEERIELDLGAAAVAGRNTAKDATAAAVTFDLLMTMKSEIPSRLRRRGLAVVGADALMTAPGGLAFDDTFKQAAIRGNNDLLSAGQVTGSVAGVTPFSTDDGVIPEDVTVAAGTGPLLVMLASGMLGYGFQRNPRAEMERDARARLTRWVGTAVHGEGTLEAAGIVVRRITG